VFVTFNHFHPSLVLAGKARAYHIHWTEVEVTGSGEGTDLLWPRINYGCKNTLYFRLYV